MALDGHGKSGDTRNLLRSVRDGNRRALGELFSRHHGRLERMVRRRLDRRIQGRIDAADVLQEASIEALERLDDYLQKPSMPFFLWLRFITAQKLLALHRHHLGTRARDPRREVSLSSGTWPEATSPGPPPRLFSHLISPPRAAARAETKMRVEAALGCMEAVEREVLVLRHFEQLSNAETARELGIQKAAASKRYTRALNKLKTIIGRPHGAAGGLSSEKKVSSR